MSFLTAALLNQTRRQVYGSTAVLRLYQLPTGSAPVLLATISNGWYAQRQGFVKGNEGDSSPGMLHLTKAAVAEDTLHAASTCEIDANGVTFSFKFDQVLPSQSLGAGYQIPLTQIGIGRTTVVTNAFKFIAGGNFGLIGGGELSLIG